jgi:CheY-like chemotaxis protein
MNTIRALVVDDEKPGRERVRRLLTRDTRVELMACCAGGAEALEAVRAAERVGSPVQVIFLDVQMPEIDGFGVIASLVRRSRNQTGFLQSCSSRRMTSMHSVHSRRTRSTTF